MKAKDLLSETNTALSSNKGRSALTILGIVIGIMAVVVMVSLITGFQSWLSQNMGLGAARVVTITSEDENHPLSTDDDEFLLRTCSELSTVIPEATSSATVTSQAASSSSDSSDVTLQMVGVDPEYFEMENTSLESGSYYSADAGAAVVLDQSAVENIYGDEDARVVGSSIDIGGNTYQIVGVIESGSALLSAANISMCYMPYSTMCDAVLGDDTVSTLLAQANEGADVSDVAAQIEGLLAARHSVEYDEDGTQSFFSASTTESSLEMLSTFTMAFNALAALVAGIALLVGGIGIMNMMLTNVTERYREIGLRKSLGARPRDITLQFLSESVALCVTGGVIGMVAGVAGAWGLCALITHFVDDLSGLTPVVEPVLVLIVFAVCAAIGIIFGYYPARRASKLNPADTLRYQ